MNETFNNRTPEIDEKPFDIEEVLRYWQVIKQRIWILISTFIIVVLTGVIYTFNITPIYKATTTVIIEADVPQAVDLNSVSRIANNEEFFQTQIKIIKSRSVISKTIDALKNSSLFTKEELEQSEFSNPIASLTDRIDIESEKNTRIVELSVQNIDPKKATKEVNTLAKTYINYNLEDRRATSKSAFLWLTEQLALLKAKVEKSEMDLLKYKESENIVSLEKRQTLLEERIAESNENYIKTSTKYMELQTMLNEIQNLQKTEFAEFLPRIINNTLIQQLKQEKNTLEIKLAEISKKYKPKHPTIIKLQSQIDNINKSLEIEINKIVKSIEIEARITESNIKSIEKNLAALKQQSMNLSKQAIQYGVLKREAESNKSMYDVLLYRLKETDISGRVTSNNIRIVDAALVPGSPVIPNTKLYLLATFFLAIFLGVGLSIFADFIDNTVKSDNDIKLHIHETVLGIVPINKNINDEDDKHFTHFSRAYNEIKTNISFYQKEHMLKSLMITSAQKSEGKTTSVLNLGKAFAHTGYKVLIIDADLFRPRLGKLLKLEENKGISNYFLDNEPPENLIVQTKTENLFALPAGLIPPNPSELIGSKKMKDLIEKLGKDFDIVLIDSAPINSTIDVSVLGSYIDGIAIAVKAHHTSKQHLRKAISSLTSLKGNIIGIMLTSAKYTDISSYYYSGYNTKTKT
jgi:capsular exopolysaccharide synthesis family protein